MPTRRKPPELHRLSGTDKCNPEQKDFGDSSLVCYKDVTSIEPSTKFRFKKTKDAWAMTIPGLLAMKIIGPLDLPALEQMFGNYDQMLHLQKQIDEYDKLHRDDWFENSTINGRLKLVNAYQKSFSAWLQLCSRFGITPEARAHLTIPHEDKKDVDPLDTVLGG